MERARDSGNRSTTFKVQRAGARVVATTHKVRAPIVATIGRNWRPDSFIASKQA